MMLCVCLIYVVLSMEFQWAYRTAYHSTRHYFLILFESIQFFTINIHQAFHLLHSDEASFGISSFELLFIPPLDTPAPSPQVRTNIIPPVFWWDVLGLLPGCVDTFNGYHHMCNLIWTICIFLAQDVQSSDSSSEDEDVAVQPDQPDRSGSFHRSGSNLPGQPPFPPVLMGRDLSKSLILDMS